MLQAQTAWFVKHWKMEFTKDMSIFEHKKLGTKTLLQPHCITDFFPYGLSHMSQELRREWLDVAGAKTSPEANNYWSNKNEFQRFRRFYNLLPDHLPFPIGNHHAEISGQSGVCGKDFWALSPIYRLRCVMFLPGDDEPIKKSQNRWFIHVYSLIFLEGLIY